MRKIRIFEHTSLDGVIEQGADYAYGAWTTPYRTPAGLAMLLEAYGTNFDLLLGRHTYDLWSSSWPKAGRSPMADRLNAATKYVATHRPDSLEWRPVQDLGPDIIEGGWRHQITRRPRPDRRRKFDADVGAARSGTGRRGGVDRLPGLAGPG